MEFLRHFFHFFQNSLTKNFKNNFFTVFSLLAHWHLFAFDCFRANKKCLKTFGSAGTPPLWKKKNHIWAYFFIWKASFNVSVSKTEKDYQSNSRHRCAFKVSQTDLPCSMWFWLMPVSIFFHFSVHTAALLVPPMTRKILNFYFEIKSRYMSSFFN